MDVEADVPLSPRNMAPTTPMAPVPGSSELASALTAIETFVDACETLDQLELLGCVAGESRGDGSACVASERAARASTACPFLQYPAALRQFPAAASRKLPLWRY